jgi:hypothetical protein
MEKCSGEGKTDSFNPSVLFAVVRDTTSAELETA